MKDFFHLLNGWEGREGGGIWCPFPILVFTQIESRVKKGCKKKICYQLSVQLSLYISVFMFQMKESVKRPGRPISKPARYSSYCMSEEEEYRHNFPQPPQAPDLDEGGKF